MKRSLAYLCGEYPRATDTFIQREIKTLRQIGLRIETIAVRRPQKTEQGSIEQEEERRNTHYLLPCSPWKVLLTHAGLLLQAPKRYFRAIHLALTVRPPGLRALLYQLFYFAEAGLVVAHLRRTEVFHIHNHAPDSSGFVAMIAAELGRLTYSMTIHGFGILSEPTRWRLTEKIERALFTICVSQHARSQAMLWSDRSCWPRIHVVHCGIEIDSETPSRIHHGEGRHILFVGRFDHVKGLPLLLEAFASLVARYPKIHLDLVGDGPERQDLERLAADYGIKEKITFHGYHSQAELANDYTRADILVLTSFAEGIPVVLLEAMAQGVPVVAPRITGIPELVEDGVSGLLFTPGDVGQLVERIERFLLDAALRSHCAQEGKKKVANSFSLVIESMRLAGICAEHLPTDRPGSLY